MDGGGKVGAGGMRGLLGSREGRSELFGGWAGLGWGIGAGNANPPMKPLDAGS